MAINRYSIVKYAPPGRALDRVDIRIVKYNLEQHVEQWKMSHRLSCYWLVYWNHTPGATLEFRDSVLNMSPENIVLIPPYTLVTAHTEHAFVHNFIEFSVGSPFDSVKMEPIVFPSAEYAPVLPADCDLVHKSLALYILVERLLMAIPEDCFIAEQPMLFEPRIQAVIRHMETHFMKKYSISELCRQVNLSESRFLHLFKQETGISPREYWLKLRLELVLRMLEDTSLSIPEIADETGFIDRSHLSRVIKARFGLTPAAIRKKYTEQERTKKN
ncbi:MAG: helix-turn-helix domain-containing protein [Lentisphaeria bacterium]|nr:helix-turn-helix domain-containing protein [Lentisphaeria bacterium]